MTQQLTRTQVVRAENLADGRPRGRAGRRCADDGRNLADRLDVVVAKEADVEALANVDVGGGGDAVDAGLGDSEGSDENGGDGEAHGGGRRGD